MATHKRVHLFQRSSSLGLGAEAGQSGLIGTAVVARALEAEHVREHTHDLVRRPPLVSAIRLGKPWSSAFQQHGGHPPWPYRTIRGGILRYVFSPYFSCSA